MKTKISLSALILCLLFALPSMAQMSKDEYKEWKNKAKDLKKNPEELKALVEENESLKNKATSLNTQVENLQDQLNGKNEEIANAQQRAKEAEAAAEAARKKAMEMSKEPKAKKQSDSPLDESGTWFKVQVGAFKNIDMSEYFKNNPNFSGETTEDGAQRITLGRFRDYWEADKFKKVLRDMGVKEAWIVPYKDGARVPLKQVLESLGPKPTN